LDQIGGQCALKLTTAPGDARRVAADAVRQGFEVVVAAGGDGTINEVLNGVADVPEAFERVRLGVLPLGTMNVFARELRLPWRLHRAWSAICRGAEGRIDLPYVIHGPNQERRYFVQLGGAGLDARAIELVRWSIKRKMGALAYAFAGLEALREKQPHIVAEGDGSSMTAQLVLLGNGRLYGGPYQIFPEADMRDGLLDVCVLPRVGWLTLARCVLPLLLGHRLPAGVVRRFRSKSLTLTSASLTPFQVDGEFGGRLPAAFSIEPSRLRVVLP
jgi:YegS/Rv2252/BmrU family lipid kinase